MHMTRGMRLPKNDRFGFAKKLLFLVQFRFYEINHSFGFLYCMTLEMTYLRAELVQLIVSRSDSELEVQRYGMKKNTSTVDPIMMQDEL